MSCVYATADPTAYLCIPDYTIGYALKDGKWQPGKYNVKGEKYILKKDDLSEWHWHIFGKEDSAHIEQCEKFNENGFIRCNFNVTVQIQFNRETLRYIATQTVGYVLSKRMIEGGLEDNMVTPYMQIGTCEPLDFDPL